MPLALCPHPSSRHGESYKAGCLTAEKPPASMRKQPWSSGSRQCSGGFGTCGDADSLCKYDCSQKGRTPLEDFLCTGCYFLISGIQRSKGDNVSVFN